MTTERTRKPTTTTLPPIVPLALIVGVSPFATDMYIPALPQIAHDLGTTPGAVQLSLTAFLVAFAVGQLLVGPVSDGVGRRPMLVVGTAVFALASVGCALAPDVVTLVLARIAQGLGGAAGAVAGRAMVSDVASGTRMAKVFGTLAAINAIGPVVAPLAGGAVLAFGTWRIMFVVLAVLGALFFAMVVLRFRETLPQERRGGVGFAANGRRIRELLAIPRFRAYVLSGVLSTVGFFAYIATRLVRVPDPVRLLRGHVHTGLRHERLDDDRHHAGVRPGRRTVLRGLPAHRRTARRHRGRGGGPRLGAARPRSGAGLVRARGRHGRVGLRPARGDDPDAARRGGAPGDGGGPAGRPDVRHRRPRDTARRRARRDRTGDGRGHGGTHGCSRRGAGHRDASGPQRDLTRRSR
ncbi:MFS transporter [Curtobacterium sp. 24E2]|nr:MFS transporter [Curtobacterium sp. 24E2]